MNLLIATRNAHKTSEIGAILGPTFQCRSLLDFPGAPEVVEDAPDFAGNAFKKASSIAQWLSGLDFLDALDGVLADDSGLEVDALGGAPGVHSARFAALDGLPSAPRCNSSDADNNAKLLRLVADIPTPKRRARFRCVLAFVPLSGNAWEGRSFSGACEGYIAEGPSGTGGFGYDPLFIPEGYDCSFAELGEAVKNTLSHRARALAKMRAYLECGDK